MFNRPFSSLNRVTIEAVDCQMNYKYIDGHLTISLEPKTPIYTTDRTVDPLLPQVSMSQTETVTIALPQSTPKPDFTLLRDHTSTSNSKVDPHPSTTQQDTSQNNPNTTAQLRDVRDSLYQMLNVLTATVEQEEKNKLSPTSCPDDHSLFGSDDTEIY